MEYEETYQNRRCPEPFLQTNLSLCFILRVLQVSQVEMQPKVNRGFQEYLVGMVAQGYQDQRDPPSRLVCFIAAHICPSHWF